MPTILYLDGSKSRITAGVKEFGFDESKHPRDPKGTGTGGHFKGKGGGSVVDIEERIKKVAKELNFDRPIYFEEELKEDPAVVAETDERRGWITFYKKPLNKKGEMKKMGYTVEGVAAHEIAHSKTSGGSSALYKPFKDMNASIVKDWQPVSKYHEVVYKYHGQRDWEWDIVAAEGYAELSRLDFQGKLTDIDPRWVDFYHQVNESVKADEQKMLDANSKTKRQGIWQKLFS